MHFRVCVYRQVPCLVFYPLFVVVFLVWCCVPSRAMTREGNCFALFGDSVEPNAACVIICDSVEPNAACVIICDSVEPNTVWVIIIHRTK